MRADVAMMRRLRESTAGRHAGHAHVLHWRVVPNLRFRKMREREGVVLGDIQRLKLQLTQRRKLVECSGVGEQTKLLAL